MSDRIRRYRGLSYSLVLRVISLNFAVGYEGITNDAGQEFLRQRVGVLRSLGVCACSHEIIAV